MYFLPTKHKCPKCGFEMDYGTSNSYSFLPISEGGNPFCYKCLIGFIAGNVPLMKEVKKDDSKEV